MTDLNLIFNTIQIKWNGILTVHQAPHLVHLPLCTIPSKSRPNINAWGLCRHMGTGVLSTSLENWLTLSAFKICRLYVVLIYSCFPPSEKHAVLSSVLVCLFVCIYEERKKKTQILKPLMRLNPSFQGCFSSGRGVKDDHLYSHHILLLYYRILQRKKTWSQLLTQYRKRSTE